MNPLQEYLHLFANGNFKVKAHDQICEWDGSFTNGEPPMLFLGCDKILTNVNNCTLIARPIEDMTDEEVIDHQYEVWQDGDFIEDHIYEIKQRARKGQMDFNELIQILSIGVYPFDQSHFDDGTVIDSRTHETINQ